MILHADMDAFYGFDESGLKQVLLFDLEERQKQAGLDAVADQVRERFGSSALRRASSIERQKPKTGSD